MKALIKRIAIGVGVSLTVAAILGTNKANQVKQIFKDLTFSIDAIKNINFLGFNQPLTITVDVMLKNNSPYEFSVNTGGLINLNRVDFFTSKGEKIGEANKQITNIMLLPNNATIIEDVQVVVQPKDILKIALQNFNSLKPKDLIAKAQIDILGKQYTI